MKTFTAYATQYVRPNGMRRRVHTELPTEYKELYDTMIEAGSGFEIEVLTTGQVSMTISNKTDDLDIEIVSNGPEVQRALCALLERKSWTL